MAGKTIYTKLLLAVCGIIFLATFVQHGSTRKTFHGDALGYYQYLPATFIYHNWDSIQQLPQIEGVSQDIYTYYKGMLQECNPGKDGKLVFNYTYGTALAELPFFLLIHGIQKLKGAPAHGFSEPYVWTARLSTLFYLILGLYWCFCLLRQFFSEDISRISVCLLLVTTNLFWFGAYQTGMAHIPIFAANALLLLYTHKLYQDFSYKNIIIVGLSLGFITASRTIDAMFVVVPILYGITSIKAAQERFQLWIKHWPKLLVGAASALLVVLPQIIYWYTYTGKFIFNTYANSKFTWRHPEIIKGLFDASNGWLYYTPIMLFALLGLAIKHQAAKNVRALALVLLPLYCYVIYSWWCWNYINGFGSRPMIHTYALLSLPLAACVQYVWQHKGKGLHFGALLFAIFFAYSNIRMSWLNHKRLMVADFNRKWYAYSLLFDFKFDYQNLCMYDNGHTQPNAAEFSIVVPIASWPSSTDSIKQYDVQPQDQYPSAKITHGIPNDEFIDYKWLQFGGRFKCTENVYTLWEQPCINIVHKHNGEQQIVRCSINNKLGKVDSKAPFMLFDYELNSWQPMYSFVKLKHPLQAKDTIAVNIDNPWQKTISYDSLWVQACK
ncbi:MAG: hypothetical protein RL660_2597 [Bacteroidota bacterium]|jgi:hypothetical protein